MAEEMRCCICDEPLTPPYHIINQRAYCARHYAAVNRPHPGFWRASVSSSVAGLGSSQKERTRSCSSMPASIVQGGALVDARFPRPTRNTSELWLRVASGRITRTCS